MFDKTLIVARYKEDISWLSQVQGYNIIVYDKADLSAPNYLPNRGREAHTYVYHIIKNYDNLSILNVFTQADPFQHSANFLEKLEHLTEKVKFTEFSNVLTSNNGKVEKFVDDLFLKIFPEYNLPRGIIVKANAMFAVHRDRIRYRSLDFWKKINEEFGDEDWRKYTGEEEGMTPFAIERLWGFIFAGPMTDRILSRKL